MSTSTDTRKRVRVIASDTTQRGKLRTVNIRTTAPLPRDVGEIPEWVQVTAAVAAAAPNQMETVMDSGGTVTGLKTVFINGYTAPN